MDNYFVTLNAINVNDKTEKKNGLTYLSWAWAWGEIKKLDPTANYTIYENRDGLNYHHDGKTAWVKTGVTVNGIEHIEYLPVMDNRNRSIPLGSITSFDVNKAIQRSLTKACARHGLGLYIYAGEDLPEEETSKEEAAREKCQLCGAPITDKRNSDGRVTKAEDIIAKSKQIAGMCLCASCLVKYGRQKAQEAAAQQRAEYEQQQIQPTLAEDYAEARQK